MARALGWLKYHVSVEQDEHDRNSRVILGNVIVVRFFFSLIVSSSLDGSFTLRLSTYLGSRVGSARRARES